MSDKERDEMVRHEFRHRGKRGLCQLLSDIQYKLRDSGGWMPRLDFVVYLAEKNDRKLIWSTN